MPHLIVIRLEQARMVSRRLERLSADSAWARISSGYRGSMVKIIERLENEPHLEHTSPEELQLLDFLIDKGFDLLTRAAKEIGDPELIRGLGRSTDIE
jgi:hypothetical protein